MGRYHQMTRFYYGFFFECLTISSSCLSRQMALSKQCLLGLAPMIVTIVTRNVVHKQRSHLEGKQNQILIVSYGQSIEINDNREEVIIRESPIIIKYLLQMGGKKWCEFCRINLPYDKKAIEDHEATRRHIQNKQKHIKYERIKIVREEKLKRESQMANSFTSTANIPKAKKGSDLQKQVEEYRSDVYASGKMAIHQLIAERTRGLYGAPIQYPEKEDLVLAENYIEQQAEEGQGFEEKEESYEMWKIDICQQTGKACFINKISQAKTYEPPKGYIMSEEQKEQWEETQRICNEAPVDEEENMGEAGHWEVVQEQEDYFTQNKAPEQLNQALMKDECSYLIRNKQDSKVKREQVKEEIKNEEVTENKSWMDNLQERLQKNEVTQQQVIGEILSNTLEDCRTVKQKNEVLKKLVKHDFEIRATLDKHDEELLKQQEGQPKKSIGFKPRKKVKLTQVIQQNDIV